MRASLASVVAAAVLCALGISGILGRDHVVRENLKCDVCQGILGIVVGSVKNKTAAEILSELDNTCTTLLPANTSLQKDCLDIASKLDKTLYDFGELLQRELFDAFALCTIASYCSIDCCGSDPAPQQVYVAYPGVPSKMGFTWVTPVSDAVTPVVQYGISPNRLTSKAAGYSHTYTHAGWLGMIHNVVASELQPSTRYYYRVGSSSSGWSELFNFKSAPGSPNDGPFVFVNIGDMGAEDFSNETVAHLKALAEGDQLHMMLHDGDISYADGFQRQWDRFGRKIQDVSARVPYMVVPGNHELPFDFGTYKQRFQLMPGNASGSNTNMFWSFDYGNVHVVGIDTESELNLALIDDQQLAWIETDLEKAQANRKDVPWIIVMGHRPLYTSGHGGQGIMFSGYLRSRVEKLFLDRGVDLVLTAHIHSYERTYPVYDCTPQKSYDRPPYPVYVVNGAAGNREGIPSFTGAQPAWSAKRLRLHGYGEITVFNSTALRYRFRADSSNAIVDEFVITK